MDGNIFSFFGNHAWIWGLIALIVVFLFVLYVRLIKCRNKVQESMGDIDVQLKKRHDLLPNMLHMAAKYMEHEKNLMTELAELRSRVMQNDFKNAPKQTMELESLLEQKLQQFKIAVENYPELKSNQTMMTAMESMNEVEEHIAAARRFYNANVNELKNLVDIFPSNIVAAWLHITYEATPFFEATATERQAVNSQDYFK